MLTDFVNAINGILDFASGHNESTSHPCQEKINHYTFYQLALIPAVLITLSFAFTKQRRQLLLKLFNGRPGLIFPMDTLSRSSRISYSCAFGATAFLVYKIVLHKTYAIEFSGNRAVKSFIAIASMFIYGMVFFPLFTSLAIGSVFGYSLGALYVWMLTAVEIFRLTECKTTEKTILLILRGLPSLVCLLYLSVSIPVRMVIAWRKGRYFIWQDRFQETNTIEEIRTSYNGHYVAKLFRKPEVKKPPKNRKDCIKDDLLSLVHRFIYQRERGFRYPCRIISVLFIAVLVIYMMTFEILLLMPPIFDLYRDGIVGYMEVSIGLEQAENEDHRITLIRQLLWVGWWVLGITKISFIVADVLATVFALLNVLHTLSSYRANLFALYRGDHSHIPPASASSNVSHCINSIKYGGFQVGYIIWSYLLHFGILGLLSFICAIIITLIMYNFTTWIRWLMEILWPIVLIAVMVVAIQFILAKFIFLQEHGRYLALNNRSLYFNFTYFMFFYNIFLGLVSCLLRILKAMLVGIAFLSRLDNSTLPRRFEFIDPGFKAYVGYMQMEVAHTHPVLIVFTRLMLLGLSEKREREKKKHANGSQEASPSSVSGQMELVIKKNHVHTATYGNVSYDNPKVDLPDLSEEKCRRRVAAHFNWHLIYTLLHNPDIRIMRKGYMQMLRQAQLLGVPIPVSDRQADVNMEQLQQQLADAREKLKPSCSKGKKEKEDDDIDAGDLKEVVAAVENDDRKQAMSESSASPDHGSSHRLDTLHLPFHY